MLHLPQPKPRRDIAMPQALPILQHIFPQKNILTGKNEYKWSSSPSLAGKTTERNIVRSIPGPKVNIFTTGNVGIVFY
jgi:hypothetical protein